MSFQAVLEGKKRKEGFVKKKRREKRLYRREEKEGKSLIDMKSNQRFSKSGTIKSNH